MISKDLIGKKIQIARNDLNITQEELAEKVGLTPNYLSKVERGLNMLSADNFLQIVEILGLTLSDFGIYAPANKKNDAEKIMNLISAYDNKSLHILYPIIETILKSFKQIQKF